jgi:hypothetical protein
MYQKTKIKDVEQPIVKRLSDNGFIPFDVSNIDYQEYLNWLAEGNEPLPAEEGNE